MTSKSGTGRSRWSANVEARSSKAPSSDHSRRARPSASTLIRQRSPCTTASGRATGEVVRRRWERMKRDRLDGLEPGAVAHQAAAGKLVRLAPRLDLARRDPQVDVALGRLEPGRGGERRLQLRLGA